MSKLVHSVSFLVLLLFPILGQAQNNSSLNKDFSKWLISPELAKAAISVSVVDLASQQVLVQTEPMISMVPASILKVATTATALEVFGPEYRFKTTLRYSGTIRNDTLLGDLQIIGGGDPTLGSKYFPETRSFEEAWISALKSKRIRVITGNLIADAKIFDDVIPGSWVWEDLGNYFGAGASGLSVYDNMIEIHLKSPAIAGQPAEVIKVVPEISGLELKNEVLSSDINSDQAYVFGNPEDSRRVIRGTIPKGQNDFVVKASMPDPATFLVNDFGQKLKSAGIELKGKALTEKAMPESEVITETLSPPLRDIIRLTNHESINLFAEHLLKHLSMQKSSQGNTKDGCTFVIDYWKAKGIDLGGLFMSDGSGLSRFDALTAQNMTGILTYMKNHSTNASDFISSLPSAGDGTLSFFTTSQFPGSCLRAKSGSMTRVRCYAGYLETRSGKTLAFTVMLNNFQCSQSVAIRKIEELLAMLRER